MKQRSFDPIALCALALLSLLQCLPLIERDLLPTADTSTLLPPLLRQALPLALFTLIAGLFRILRKPARPRPRPSLGLAAAIGLCLFVFPAILLPIAARELSPLTTAGLSTLIPVFCAVLEPHLVLEPNARSSPHTLLATLIAFSGALLVFPFALPSSTAAALGLAASLAASLSIALAYCLLVRTAAAGASMRLTAIRAALPACLALIACSFALSSFHPARNLSPAAIIPFAIEILLELASLVLLFWLASRIPATSLATRALLSLLFAILLEAALLQQPITALMAAGLLLIAVGTAILLFARAPAPEPTRLL
jgi:drug/metabolite transporter (DMT)-like permease